MHDVNRVIIRGRLGAPVETRNIPNGSQVATLRVATSESWERDGQRHESTTWHRIIAWNELARVAAPLQVGQALFCEGRLVSRSYEASDGSKRYVVEVKAISLWPLSPPRGKRSTPEPRQAVPPPDEPEPEVTVGDDDIPF